MGGAKPILMKGEPVADAILEAAGARVRAIAERTGVTPCLATVLVGNDPASEKYVASKGRLCGRLGMKSVKLQLPEETTTDELVSTLQGLCDDASVHGILLQHPVPAQIDERRAFETIAPEKDVDGVTFASFSAMSFSEPGFASCTPEGIMRLLRAYDVEIEGKHAVVIGRSPILGRPVAALLLGANATVTVCHSRTRDLAGVVGLGELVVAAVGKPRFVQGDWIKPGAIVIDAGFNPGPRGNIGDVDFDSTAERAGMITPVPGGVGPLTLAVLMDQTSIAAARQLGLPAERDDTARR